MKKFKNDECAIVGEAILQEAFMVKLKEIGYTPSGKDRPTHTCKYLKVYPRISKYQMLSYTQEGEMFTLPKDWDRALAYVSEVKEEIPEYVELIKDSIWRVNKGAVCKVLSENKYASTQYVLENIYVPNTMKKEDNKHAFFMVKSGCKPSTKEAYEAQNKPKLEVDKWYKVRYNDKCLIYLTDNTIRDTGCLGYNCGYGFDGDGKWLGTNYNLCATEPSELRKATKEEVEAALIKEARRRYGSNSFKCLHNVTSCEVSSIPDDKLDFNLGENCLRQNYEGCGCIYWMGQWAEVIESTPDITINGYKAEFFDNYVEFGCAKIARGLLQEIDEAYKIYALDSKFIHGNRFVTGIKIGNGLFTIDQIREIVEYYKNK